MIKNYELSFSRRRFLGTSMLAGAGLLSAKGAFAKQSSARHVVLLGDSIFDNGTYVGGGPDVIKQVRDALPLGDSATLLAIDGSVISNVSGQLAGIPSDATHLVISVGGNDALRYRPILAERAQSVGEALIKLADVRDKFAADYRAMLDKVMQVNLPTAICTVYDGLFPSETERRMSSVGATIFNDCITREGSARNLAIIDLRVIFNRPEDFANSIEPSSIGGAKIASAITAFVARREGERSNAEFFVELDGRT